MVCGHGKPSSKRIKDALLSRIAPGSVIVHDKEKSHAALVKAAKCTDEAFGADARDPTYLEAMELVNNLCPWLRRYLIGEYMRGKYGHDARAGEDGGKGERRSDDTHH